ncbi:hypothetical protein NC796_24095 [Aliifodinibius sp. S!AR15-10]|uniref:hypothetical protein n=1 Tax=Aliifodinibius sp. S!AR15-10 TaxID=2950437 RepID=UPI00285A3D7E|nr:hypothetical protein [Aliifodinibius sp. S!AR15-10]MDR8394252.1 hypothetical protein [Aliifodinibius sp. S!AR15-10]
MDKKKILKILSFIGGPLVVMAIAAYFLFPYLNEEKYEEISAKYEDNQTVVTADGNRIGRDFESLVEQVKDLQAGNNRLQNLVDSLRATNEELENKLEEQKKLIEQQEQAGTESLAGAQAQAQGDAGDAENAEDIPEDENFADRVKSLLSLDDESLTPIVSELSDEQLLRLYESGGTIQRKKLLRTLEPKRAAQLMEEVML